MDKPESDIHFKLRELFYPRMNILKEVGMTRGFHIIDQGCGPRGYLTATSKRAGRSGNIHGIDIHPAGNKPTPLPKCNRTCSVYRMPQPKDRAPPTCYEYESIHANYTASPDAEVLIHTSSQERTHGVLGLWGGLATITDPRGQQRSQKRRTGDVQNGF
ncbi:MAG: hypothetical protein EF813_07735 [Methanosarcinales archaeon]|nr:MAG: hypothetical protein EF813_07735 [Methanosarcinales archaeon]